MTRVLVFGGTSEGKEIVKRLTSNNVYVTLCMVYSYSKDEYEGCNNLTILVGARQQEEIELMVRDYDYIVDATHPYAKVVTESIRLSCIKHGKERIRILRDVSSIHGDIYLESIEEAVDYLNKTCGNILLTTGSNNISLFNRLDSERIYARVLPSIPSLEKCLNSGIKGRNIIAMQGPFSREMNMEHIRFSGAKYLVTKESGDVGGYIDKIEAARKMGITSIVIGREGESGVTLDAAVNIICGEEGRELYFPMFFSIRDKKVLVVGGGAIALRRLKTLIKFTGNITVVAREVLSDVMTLCRENNIKVYERGYISGEVEDYHMVIALTNSREINNLIYRECRDNNILCNIGDKKEECDFYFPGVITRGHVVVGVTASGTSHRDAKNIRDKINKII
ncbi:MAG: precorrin-6A reductase [Clostridium sp.]|uniref:precorrin-6A reductase n=1 Tax=Clostridium sp. TaxID=1506 RepID=UPI002FC9EBEF